MREMCRPRPMTEKFRTDSIGLSETTDLNRFVCI